MRDNPLPVLQGVISGCRIFHDLLMTADIVYNHTLPNKRGNVGIGIAVKPGQCGSVANARGVLKAEKKKEGLGQPFSVETRARLQRITTSTSYRSSSFKIDYRLGTDCVSSPYPAAAVNVPYNRYIIW